MDRRNLRWRGSVKEREKQFDLEWQWGSERVGEAITDGGWI